MCATHFYQCCGEGVFKIILTNIGRIGCLYIKDDLRGSINSGRIFRQYFFILDSMYQVVVIMTNSSKLSTSKEQATSRLECVSIIHSIRATRRMFCFSDIALSIVISD